MGTIFPIAVNNVLTSSSFPLNSHSTLRSVSIDVTLRQELIPLTMKDNIPSLGNPSNTKQSLKQNALVGRGFFDSFLKAFIKNPPAVTTYLRAVCLERNDQGSIGLRNNSASATGRVRS